MKSCFTFVCCLCSLIALGQKPIVDTEAENKKLREQSSKADKGWTFVGSIGADFLQTLLVNPRIGSGDNRIALGSDAGVFATYKLNRFVWDNVLGLKFGVQRIGSSGKPFQKNLDELLLDSKAGYAIQEGGKLYYSGFARFKTSITPSYQGNYLSNNLEGVRLPKISEFLSPALVQSGIGLDYKLNDHLSLFLSPATLQAIIVANDSIASLSADGKNSLHGNPWRSRTDFDHVKLDFGASFRATYTQKFWADHISFASTLMLFSNYLKNPQNIDVDWRTQTDFTIYKGLALGLSTILLYADEIPVQISSSYDRTTGVYTKIGKSVFFTEQLTIKYRFQFKSAQKAPANGGEAK